MEPPPTSSATSCPTTCYNGQACNGPSRRAVSTITSVAFLIYSKRVRSSGESTSLSEASAVILSASSQLRTWSTTLSSIKHTVLCSTLSTGETSASSRKPLRQLV